MARATRLALAALGFGLAIGAARADPASIDLPVPFPESVTSTSEGVLYVSSFRDGGVLKIAPGSSPVTFLNPGEHGTRSTFGVLVDEKSGTLWVASNDISAIGVKGPSDVEGSWVKGFDLKSGGAPKVSARLPTSPAAANDFAVGDDGTLYVTNVLGPQIFQLKPGAKELEVFVQDDRLKGGLDGIAVDESGALIVNTFFTGELFRIDVKAGAPGAITKLKTSRPLKKPDGLRSMPGGFLMVEGDADTLDRVTITGDEAKIETVKEFAGPTGLTVVRDTVWVAEGQLGYLSEPKLKGKPLPSFQLRSVPLPKD
jgi:hypothetical protein